MRTITLSDGTTYTVSMCGASGGVLWITIDGYEGSMLDAVTTFSDATKTASIAHAAGENDHVTFAGYTTLTSLQFDNEGGLTIALKKE